MSTVALAFMVYKLTGSVLHMGGILAVSALPVVVTSWIGGALLDRFSAKHVMVLADAARAVLILAMPFLAEQAVGLVYAVAGVIGVFSAFFNPAQIKLVSELADRSHLVKANSYLSVSRDGGELVGYLAGGMLVSWLGYTSAFAIDAGSYAISALLLLGLPQALPRAEAPLGVKTLVAGSPAVLARLWRRAGLRTNLLLGLFPVMFFAMDVPASWGLVLDVFGRGSLELGILEVSIAAGLILGGLVISRMSLEGDKNTYVFFSFLAVAACLVAISFSRSVWLSIGLMGVAGAFNVGLFVPSITMMQEIPAGLEKGRLIALRSGFGQLGAAVGLLLGGVLGEALGITRLFLVAGLAVVGLSLIIYVPYRIAARRRARTAWTTATASGATRVTARRAAREAALGGMEATAWAMAAESATLEVER